MKKLLTIFLFLSSVSLNAQEYQICEKDSLFGICDYKKIIVPQIYNEILPCYNYPNWYLVKLKDKYGIINTKNKIVLPIEYQFDMENSNPFNIDGYTVYIDSSSIIILNKNGKYGAINSKLKTIISFEYDYLEYFYYYSAPAYIAKKDNNYMLIDINEHILTKSKYNDFASFFHFMNNNITFIYAVFKNENNKWVFVDESGKEYTSTTGKIYNNTDTISYKLQPIKYKGKYVVIDYHGVMIGQEYDNITLFVPCNNGNTYSYAVVGKDNKYGILRSDGKEIINIKYDKIDEYHLSNCIGIVSLNDKIGMLDLISGKEMLPPIYDEIYSMSNSSMCYAKKGGKYALLRTSGDFITDFIFEDIQLYDDIFFGAKQNGKWGYIDSTGKVIIPFQFEVTQGFFSGDITPQKKDGKWGYINRKGETVIPFKYDNAGSFYSKSKAEIILNGKKGWIDKNGTETWE